MRRHAIYILGVFVAMILGIAGCGGGDSSPVVVDVSGVWVGSISSSAAGTVTMTFRLSQAGDHVTGDYSMSNGVNGKVTGTSNATFNATLTPTNTGCTGTATGTGAVTSQCFGLVCENKMDFNYKGTFNGPSSCAGVETGTGTLTKQIVIPF